MKKLFASLCAAAMAMTAVVSTPVGVSAAPIVPLVKSELPTSVEQVQYRRYPRRGVYSGARVVNRNFYRNGNGAYYNGHRGYRSYRSGYRRYNDFWFPAGAFVAGALIGGALAAPSYDPYYAPRRVYRGGGNSHVQWCYNRYRSYRASDNTFQPYNGPRQLCYSPYN